MLELTVKGDKNEIAELIKQFPGLFMTDEERQDIAKRHFANGVMWALKYFDDTDDVKKKKERV